MLIVNQTQANPEALACRHRLALGNQSSLQLAHPRHALGGDSGVGPLLGLLKQSLCLRRRRCGNEQPNHQLNKFHGRDYSTFDPLGNIGAMLNELTALADKTDALISVVNQLRQENTRLRNQNAQLNAEHRAMGERLQLASEKLEAIVERLP